jgi:hypothetical protein
MWGEDGFLIENCDKIVVFFVWRTGVFPQRMWRVCGVSIKLSSYMGHGA